MLVGVESISWPMVCSFYTGSQGWLPKNKVFSTAFSSLFAQGWCSGTPSIPTLPIPFASLGFPPFVANAPMQDTSNGVPKTWLEGQWEVHVRDKWCPVHLSLSNSVIFEGKTSEAREGSTMTSQGYDVCALKTESKIKQEKKLNLFFPGLTLWNLFLIANWTLKHTWAHRIKPKCSQWVHGPIQGVPRPVANLFGEEILARGGVLFLFFFGSGKRDAVVRDPAYG